jgi:hypothetical protein
MQLPCMFFDSLRTSSLRATVKADQTEVLTMRITTFLVAAVLLGGQSAWADGKPPHIQWKQWRVFTSEGWNLDTGPEPKFPLQFPLSNLFDGDPNTTWVYYDVRKPSAALGRSTSRRAHRVLTLEPTQPVVIDSIAVMNGYNRRPDLF